MRTKTYIAFDGDNDLMSYRTIQGWNKDKTVPFSLNDAHDVNEARDNSLPESIINQLRERMELSKNVVLLISPSTNQNRKGILQWELGYAIRNKLPIILTFIKYSNDNTVASDKLWYELQPKIHSIIRDADEKYCLLCPFDRDKLFSAIQTYSNTNLPPKNYTWFWNR